MKDGATMNGEANDKLSEPATSGERRPSVEALQNMLKRVSKSPFHNQYQAGDVSTPADQHQMYPGQERVHRPSSNPFYSYFLESTGQSNNPSPGASREAANTNSTFVPEFQSSPMDQPDTSLYPQNDIFNDFAPKTTPDIFLKPQSPFQNVTLDTPDIFKAGQSSASLNGHKDGSVSDERDVIFASKEVNQSFNAPDTLFPNTNPFYNSTTNDSASSHTLDIFNKENQSPAFVESKDIFNHASDDKPDIFAQFSGSDSFQKPVTRVIDFSSIDDPFGDSPLRLSDPFQDPSLDTSDVFKQTSPTTEGNGIAKVPPVRPKPPRPTPPGRPGPPATSATPARPTPPYRPTPPGTPTAPSRPTPPYRPTPPATSTPPGTPTAPSRPTPPGTPTAPSRPTPPARPPKITVSAAEKPQEIVLTSPQGSQRSILQPTPLIQAQSQSVSPSHSPKLAHVSTFRRPPKPLPRIRRSKTSVSSKPTPPETPPKPERPSPPALPTLARDEDIPDVSESMKSPDLVSPKPSPKPPLPKLSPKPSMKPLLSRPIVRRKQKATDTKPLSPENYVVFEDILLIGQEQCVEDWPEDSPEVQPDFKPRGTLRLRRESLMVKTDSDTEDQDGAGSSTKKKDKFKTSLSARRDSKERFSDECTSRSRTNSASRKSSTDYYTDTPYSSQELKKDENEDPEQWGDYKKPHFKTKVNSLLRRSSASAAFSEQKHMNGNVPREYKDSDFKNSKLDSIRRHSEGTMLDAGSGESGDDFETKKSRKLKSLKFLHNKGLGFNKQNEDELKGAQGYTPHKGSKEDLFGAQAGSSTRKKSPDDGFDPFNKAALMNDDFPEKSNPSSAGLDGYEEAFETEEQKSKSPKRKSFPLHRKSKSSYVTPDRAEYLQSPQPDFNDEFAEDVSSLKGKQAPTEMYNFDEDQIDISEPKKTFKFKPFKKNKNKNKSMYPQREESPGATSSDYMSEAAKAELMAAEKDRYAMDEFEDGEDGDTDSLMEWWDRVEQWDEVPSDDEEMALKEDESKSFSILADKVQRALRLFNKVFVERAEVLWQSVITLHTIADDISTFHNKARIAGITGGTTTAVGGVAAIAGLALAPITFGASLVVTAVGVGIATAGGIASASAAISDNVNNANDRKKVEALLLDNEASLLELSKILHFANTGLYKLRGHPFLRSGTQHYSQDWEVRRAVQMIGLVDTPVMKATDFIDSAVAAIQGLFQGIDKYFLKDTRELKKGCKKEIVAEIKDVANVLNDCVVELNAAREELQEGMGEV